MKELNEDHANYQRVAEIIAYLEEHHLQQPSLEEISAISGLSKFHVQRMFSEWAGVSPKQFLGFLTKEYAKHSLRNDLHSPSSLFEAALDAGLSGGGRLHDLFVNFEAVTPGEYKAKGEGLRIDWGVHSSVMGYCFVAMTERGICKLAFIDNRNQQDELLSELQSDWPEAVIEHNPLKSIEVVEQMFSGSGELSLKLLLKGTPFKLSVWQALIDIPYGELCSYQDVAKRIGNPKATRAVASAVASNHISYLIPCHRVIRGSGVMGKYRWGSTRKKAMIAWEASQNTPR